MNEHFICLADIKNKIHEAGLFRDGEKIVLTSNNCILLEYYTGKTYSYRMVERENQRQLALEMLHCLQDGKLALCEAEVGTGKTHAYILAVTVHNLFSSRKTPTIISTSTIALQKALTEEYIPQISKILMEHRIIDDALSFVVRKGKRHHACDVRVKTYQSSILHNERNEDLELLDILSKLYTGGCSIDLDGLPLSDYVKERICVTDCHRGCPCSAICRYRSFTRNCLLGNYDFQITNLRKML